MSRNLSVFRSGLAGIFAYVFGFAFLLGSVTIAAAMPQVSTIELQDITFMGCNNGVIEGSLRVVAKAANGEVVNSGSAIDIRQVYTTASGMFETSGGLLSGQVVPFTFGFRGTSTSYGTVQAILGSNPDIASPLYTFDCKSGAVMIEIIEGDGRLNQGQNDLLSALYRARDEYGDPVIRVYEVFGSEGKYEGDYTLADFEPHMGTPPAENTLIRSIGRTTLYVLTTGEFQINIGPDPEGKWAAIVFHGPLATGVYVP